MTDSEPTPFTHCFRVRYSEVDPQNVVFNARYLDYADVVVTEFFRTHGLSVFGNDSVEFHVARAEIDFRIPIRADEMVEGQHIIARFGRSSMEQHITLRGVDDPADAEPRAKIVLINVHVDLETGRPVPIPDEIRERLANNLVCDSEKEGDRVNG